MAALYVRSRVTSMITFARTPLSIRSPGWSRTIFDGRPDSRYEKGDVAAGRRALGDRLDGRRDRAAAAVAHDHHQRRVQLGQAILETAQDHVVQDVTGHAILE